MPRDHAPATNQADTVSAALPGGPHEALCSQRGDCHYWGAQIRGACRERGAAGCTCSLRAATIDFGVALRHSLLAPARSGGAGCRWKSNRQAANETPHLSSTAHSSCTGYPGKPARPPAIGGRLKRVQRPMVHDVCEWRVPHLTASSAPGPALPRSAGSTRAPSMAARSAPRVATSGSALLVQVSGWTGFFSLGYLPFLGRST